MKRGLLALIFLVSTLIFSEAGTGSNLPLYPPASGYVLTDAFPGITFSQPVAMATAPGETNRLFVVERGGKIMVITNLANPSKTVFLDLTKDWLIDGFDGLEQGLLGLAFHPGFRTNGYFYVYRTKYMYEGDSRVAGVYNVLSRFSVADESSNHSEASSELQLIAQRDVSRHHNAGDIKFGPDGYLYLSLGESGPTGDDVPPTPQSIDHGLFAGIIRIDVDKRPGNLPPNPHRSSSTNYFVPVDNPFVGITNYQNLTLNPAKIRTEFYAIGFRNPWRMNFDPLTGKLFVGDVGQDAVEEVNVIEPGGNYGWPYYEGTTRYWPQIPSDFSYNAPALKYNHGNKTNEGNCVIGGVFYYGSAIPQLYGRYVFADFTKGNVWSAAYAGGSLVDVHRLTGQAQLSCFGIDPRDNEILTAGFEYGKIYKLNYIDSSAAPEFPQTLSETGIFDDLQTLSPKNGIYPYEVNHPFWSDNALKKRWFKLPDSDEKIGYSLLGNWDFPEGTVWIKQFDLETIQGIPSSRKRIETRFIVKTGDTAYGVTYRWNEEGTEAFLVPEEGADRIIEIQNGSNRREQVWHFPGRAECMACHLKGNGLAAAFNTLQLNRQIERGGTNINQLQWLMDLEAFKQPVTDISQLPRLTALTETDAPIEDRARSYLHANCSICHQPATSKNIWDARITTPFERSTANFVDAAYAPINLLHRFSASDGTRMPPIASNLHDTNAYNILNEWLATRVPPTGWHFTSINSTPGFNGSAAFPDSKIRMGGYGRGILPDGDQIQFLNHPASNDITIRVQVELLNKTNTMAAGIMLRKSFEPDSPAAFIGINTDGNGISYVRKTQGGSPSINQGATSDIRWLKISKIGSEINLLASADQISWSSIAHETVELGQNFYAGITTWSPSAYKEGYSEFTDYSLRGLRWVSPPSTNITAGNPIYFEVEPVGFTNNVPIQWYSDHELIGVSTNDHSFVWTNALAGNHLVQAVASDSSGLEVYSEYREVTVAFPKAIVEFNVVNTNSSGNWLRHFGGEAIYFPGVTNPLPANVSIQTDASLNPIPASASDPRALINRSSPSGERIAQEFKGSPIELTLDLKDGLFHLLTLYFVDWDDSSAGQQVTIKDQDTGAILEQSFLTNYAGGVYLQWRVRGTISVSIERPDGGDASLAGVFLDKSIYNHPNIEISDFTRLTSASHPMHFTARVLDSENPIEHMVLFINKELVVESLMSPWEFSLPSLLTGEYTAFVRAYDSYGVFGDSEPVSFTVLNAVTHARFVGSDSTTQGNWLNKYGASGYVIPHYSTNLSSSIDWALANNTSVLWAWPGATETRALQLPSGSGRIASAFYNSNTTQDPFSISAKFKDGLPHRVSLYFLDWDRDNWSFTVTLKDEFGNILDHHQVNNFDDGLYLTWEVAGSVTFQFSNVTGFDTVAGIFIDPISPNPDFPTLTIETPGLEPDVQLPANLLVQAAVSNSPALPNEVRFYLDGDWVGSSQQGQPYSTRLKSIQSGSHLLRARAIFADATWIDSTPLLINAVPAPMISKAVFLDRDSITSGDWKGSYGNEGYQIYLVGTNLPAYAQINLNDPLLYIWNYWGNSQQGLELVPGIRVAATWYQFPTVEALTTFDDARWHTLSVYCLDWDDRREQAVQVLDPETMQVLDEQELGDFTHGQYLSWQVRGQVLVRAEVPSLNAVISGFFIDPISPLEEWRLNCFANLDQAHRHLALDDADPDEDGIPNITEFKFGLNPNEKSALPGAQAYISNNQLVITIPVNPDASNTELGFEISSDLITWLPINPSAKVIIPGQNLDHARFSIPLNTPGLQSAFVRFGVRTAD